MQYVAEHLTDFKSIADIDPDENLPMEEYLAKIAQPHQSVGEYVLSAVCEVIKKSIRLYYNGSKPWVYTPVNYTDMDSDKNCINLLYGDVNSSNDGHYRALVCHRSEKEKDHYHPMDVPGKCTQSELTNENKEEFMSFSTSDSIKCKEHLN